MKRNFSNNASTSSPSIINVGIYSFIFKEVDLIPDGSKIEVTKENRMKYLDALAQYKLHTRVSAEVEAFTKGITHKLYFYFKIIIMRVVAKGMDGFQDGSYLYFQHRLNANKSTTGS